MKFNNHPEAQRPALVRAGKYFLPGLVAVLLALTGFGFVSGKLRVLTADQQGYRLFKQGNYQEAAEHFNEPLWLGAAYFRAGQYEEAAGVFAGYDTAETAYNQATSLVMLGKYEAAVARYERALALEPGWGEAETNLEIAKSRARALKKEGGNMTGGQLGADDFVFEKGKSSPEAENEQIQGGGDMSDAEMRAIWLRNVQTKPADFLRVKFAYQHANPVTGEEFSESPETQD